MQHVLCVETLDEYDKTCKNDGSVKYEEETMGKKMVQCIDDEHSMDELREGEWYEVVGDVGGSDYQLKGLKYCWNKRRFSPPAENEEYTGSSASYYKLPINSPIDSGKEPYVAECQEIIEALNMTFAEGNAFKAIWRSCAARTLGVGKKGYDDGLYDAEKVVFFGERMVAAAKGDLKAK